MSNLRQTISDPSSSSVISFAITYRKRIRLIIKILITALCAGQIYSIALDYASGETTSKVNLTTPSRIELPNVSLCFPFLDLINFTKAADYESRLNYLLRQRPFFDDFNTHRDIYYEIYSILGNLTIKQLHELLKDSEHILNMILLSPTSRISGDPINGYKIGVVNASCETIRYYRQPSFCLTIICKNETGGPVVYIRSDIFQQPYDGNMIYIQFNRNISLLAASVSIILTANNHLIEGSGHTAYRIAFNRKTPATYVITYGKVINVLIKENYGASCLDYSTLGYRSRNGFIDACLNNMSAEATRSVFYGASHFFEESKENLRNDYYQFYIEYLNPNATERIRLRKLYKAARQRCANEANKPDCRYEILSPVGFRTSRRLDGIYALAVRAPTAPYEFNQYYPEYTSLDLLIYLASSLNFWFGLSLISLSERLLNFYCGLFESRRDPGTTINQNKCVSPRPMKAMAVSNKRPRVPRIKEVNSQMPNVYY